MERDTEARSPDQAGHKVSFLPDSKMLDEIRNFDRRTGLRQISKQAAVEEAQCEMAGDSGNGQKGGEPSSDGRRQSETSSLSVLDLR